MTYVKDEKSPDGHSYPPQATGQNPAYVHDASPRYPTHPDEPPPSYSASISHQSEQCPNDRTGPPQNNPFNPDPGPGASADSTAEAAILQQALKFTTHAPPPPQPRAPPLPQPIAIPQTRHGLGQPFARCYAPSLHAHAIPAATFLAFLDHLNIVATASPPLRLLDLASNALGFAPSGAAQLASVGLSAAARVAQVVVSRRRTETYVREANRGFFAPRALRVRIVAADEVAAAVGVPGGMAGALAPVAGDVGAMERRMGVLRGYVAELQWDGLGAVEAPTGVLARLSAGQVRWEAARAEKRVAEGRRKGAERAEKEKGKLEKKKEKEKGGGKEQKKYAKEMEKVERDAMRAEMHRARDGRKGGMEAERAAVAFREEMRRIDGMRTRVARAYGGGGYDDDDDGPRVGSCAEGPSRDGGEEAVVAATTTTTKKDREGQEARKALWVLVENL